MDETRSCVGAPSRLRGRRRRDRWKGGEEWNKEGEREACVQALCTCGCGVGRVGGPRK